MIRAGRGGCISELIAITNDSSAARLRNFCGPGDKKGAGFSGGRGDGLVVDSRPEPHEQEYIENLHGRERERERERTREGHVGRESSKRESISKVGE